MRSSLYNMAREIKLKERSENRIKLSIIIVTYNCLEYLKTCLESIDKFNDIYDELEIIVVDNDSCDGCIEWLNKNRPEVNTIRNENLGYGHGNNVGARMAKGKYLLFLNPDTILIEPIFNDAIKIFQSDEKIGCFGFQLVNNKLQPVSSYGFRFPIGFIRVTICNLLIKLKIYVPSVMYTSGADLFIRKEAFDKAGLFDEKIFMYCEEADICNRLNAAGYKNIFFKHKRIIHMEGKATNAKFYDYYWNVLKSRKYYCKKYGIDFKKVIRSEKRYCRLKSVVFFLIGNKENSEIYSNIVNKLKYYEIEKG